MEEGVEYNVYYEDDSRVRHKILVFKDSRNGMIHFFNSRTGKEEFLPVTRIIRVEGMKEVVRDEAANEC